MVADTVCNENRAAATVNVTLGHILSVSGSRASVGILAASQADADDPRVTVGQFVVVRSGDSRLIGVITDVSLTTIAIAREQGYYATAELDLMGEIRNDPSGASYFQRGVTGYPAIGDPGRAAARL
jgi:hypothetical protein